MKRSQMGELASGKLHILKLPFGCNPHNKHAPSALSVFQNCTLLLFGINFSILNPINLSLSVSNLKLA